jgi:exopolysaccharide production protein ExoZ
LKLSSLQFLRALAAWMVVFHHYNQVIFDWDMGNSILGAQFGDFFKVYGKLGVDIFFVISGFIMFYSLHRSPTSSGKFIINRIVRVVPVYWFYTFLLLLLTTFSIAETSSQFTFVSLIKSLLFIPHDNPSETLGAFPFLTVGWTLNFEMFFYVTLACMLAVFKNKAVIGTFILLLVLPVVWGDHWAFGFRTILTSSYLAEFAIGLLLGFVFCNGNYFPRNNNFAALAIFAIAISVMYIGGVTQNKYLIIGLIVTSVLCIRDAIFDNKLGRLLCYLGDISYSTYLVHAIILFVLVNYFGKSPSPIIELIVLVLYIFGVLISSTLSFKVLEVGSFNKSIKNILYARLETVTKIT